MSAYLEALAFLPLDKHLGRDTLAIYRKACGFIPKQCDDVYGSILDASDFLYKVVTKEPFVNKQILGYVTVFYGSAKHLYRYARLILEKFIGSFLHAVVIAAFLGESVLELLLGETKVLLLSCFCMQGESKRQSALLVGNGQQK